MFEYVIHGKNYKKIKFLVPYENLFAIRRELLYNDRDIYERGVGMNNSSGRKGQEKRLSKKELRQKKKIQRTIGMALTVVLFIAMAVFMGLLMYLDILPTLYIVAIVVVFVLILLYVLLSQFTKAHMVGKVVAGLLSVILAFGCYFVAVGTGTLGKLTEQNETVDVMSIIVLADDEAKTINDTSLYVYGINAEVNTKLTQETIDHINEELGTEVIVTEYSNWPAVVEALYSGEVQVIIFNESYRTTMEEYYVSFSEDTKVLHYKEIVSEIQVEVPNKEVTDECFSVLLSGTDTTGKLNSTTRSDVNIIATVNPNTHQILLVTIPRDLYVKLYYGDGTDSGNSMDKLTHASTNGLACSIDTIEHVFDTDIDYYVRLNFTGLEKLVDALGGIVVESDYAFTSYAQTHTFQKGPNTMDGYAALIFARERYAFSDGDFQRSRNQIKVIQAIADKAMSVTMLTNYTGIMNSLSDVVTTNIPQEQMTSLVKMQLAEMPTWTFKSYNVTGTTGKEYCLALGKNASIVYQDAASIELAKLKIDAILEGKDPDLVTGNTAQ